jgi:hypothetical protein
VRFPVEAAAAVASGGDAPGAWSDVGR